MRRRIAASLVVVGIAAVPTCSEASMLIAGGSPAAPRAAKNRITMKPSTGRAHAHFVVSFTAPQKTTGGVAGTLRRYQVSAHATARQGCQSSAFASVGAKRNGARVSAKLIPEAGGLWCAGTFHGKIIETIAPICGPARVCPQFIAVVRTIGKFTFHVRASGTNDGPVVGPVAPQPPCVPVKDGARAICG